MSGQAKMKGRKTVSRRLTEDIEEEMPTPTESLTDLFEIFIKAKEIEGLRERTLIDHKTHFKYFNTYLNDFHPSLKCASEVTTEILRSYIHFLKHEKGIWDNHQWLADKYAHQKGLSPVTINVRLRSLKCFLKFLFDEGYLQENPAARIKLLKTEKDTIESFSEEQISKLLKQPDQRTFAGFRDYVLMLFMLDTGIRVREALNLQANNFSYEQKTIIVPAHVAKNNQARILPLSQRTAKCIKLLIKEDTIFEGGCRNIFLTNYGEKLDPSVIRQRLTDYGKKEQITGVRVSPHTFRHTFAKYYILNGGDAFTLQRLLDHSTMNTVRKYIQMNNEDIKIQHNQFSPINHLSI